MIQLHQHPQPPGGRMQARAHRTCRAWAPHAAPPPSCRSVCSCALSSSDSSSSAASSSSGRSTASSAASSTGKTHAVVVGGGIGGLVAAAKLAKEGLRVTLLEQNEEVGGRCQSLHVETARGRFRFDTGPSLLLFPDTYKHTFASLGSSLEEHVSIKRVEPAYRVFFEGAGAPDPSPRRPPSPASSSQEHVGGYLDMLHDPDTMARQLEGVEAGAGRAYRAWLSNARAALEVGMREFITRDFASLLDFLDPRRLLPLAAQVNVAELLGQHDARLARYFTDPRLRALFSFQDLYVGLSPQTAPGVYSLLAATELVDGVWYPVGGFQKVKDGLASVARKLGVHIRTRTRVLRINTKQAEAGTGTGWGRPKHRVTGVTVEGGETIQADVVVSNRDVPLTYGLLSHPEAAARASDLSRKAYSAGVIAYNMCLDTRLDALLQHNVFISGQYGRSWRRAHSPATLLPRPNMYMHLPSRADPSAAPSGCDSLMVLLPVANLQEMEAELGSSACEAGVYSELVEAGRQAIARTLREEGVCDDVLSHVLHESITDPCEWQQRYGLQHGAAFGLAHGLSQLAILRPGARDAHAHTAGLYLVGASARPGNGVPLCMISGDLTAAAVLQDVAAGVVG